MDENKLTVGFTDKDTKAVKSAMQAIESTLSAKRIIDLTTAQLVIGTTDAFINKATMSQIKALGIVKDREYWRMGKYMDKSGHARNYISFTDYATKYYSLSKSDLSVKVRTAALIDETGLHSIFPITEQSGITKDYSVTALGIIAQFFTVEQPTGKKLKNGKDEVEKLCDISAAIEAHNNGKISPFMSVATLKKALKADDIEENVPSTSEPTEGNTEPTEGNTEPTEGNTEPTEGNNYKSIKASELIDLLNIGDIVTVNGNVKYLIVKS